MKLTNMSDKALQKTLHSVLNKIDDIRLNNYNPATKPVLAHYQSIVSDIKAEQRRRKALAKEKVA